MKQRQIFFLLVALSLIRNASGNAPRVVDVKSADGVASARLSRENFPTSLPISFSVRRLAK